MGLFHTQTSPTINDAAIRKIAGAQQAHCAAAFDTDPDRYLTPPARHTS